MEVSWTEKDPISTLPEHIIHEILSRLTIIDVARTTCLSKGWRNSCVSFPCLNIDQQHFNDLPFHHFKQIMYQKVLSIKEEEQPLLVYKFRLRMHCQYVRNATEEIEECTSLVLQTSTIQEFDFQIIHGRSYHSWDELFHHLYNVKTLVLLRLSGLGVIQPSNTRDIKFSHLEIVRLENVYVKSESDIDWLFTSCPMIREISLVECDGLEEHLKVCDDNLSHLKQLEVIFCRNIRSVEIQVPSLEKFVLAEIARRGDEYLMSLTIDFETSKTLRELTLCNSGITGSTFTRIFSRCSNVENLVLESCFNFFKIKIASKKLRKLIIKRCYDLRVTDIEAPNLTTFKFCNYASLGSYDEVIIDKKIIQNRDEISQLQECMLDFNTMLRTKNIWISLWFDKFSDSADQKLVIYFQKHISYDVVVLEDWGSMAELTLMTQMCESAVKTIITTMSFIELSNYVFGNSSWEWGKNKRVLAISTSRRSMLHEVLRNKSNFSCTQWSYEFITKIGMDALLSTTCWPFLSTLRATSFSVSSISHHKT